MMQNPPKLCPKAAPYGLEGFFYVHMKVRQNMFVNHNLNIIQYHSIHTSFSPSIGSSNASLIASASLTMLSARKFAK